MKNFYWRIVFGIVLVLVGGLALLQTMKVITLQADIWDLIPSAAFILGGLAFITHLISDRTKNWWAAIPGFILLAIGVQIGLFALVPSWEASAGGAIVLGGISLAFWVVYFLHRDNWWAIIPGGVLATITIISLLAGAPYNAIGVGLGGFFFLGLAVTFGLLFVLPTGETRMTWPLIPAFALLIMSTLVFAFGGGASGYVWPIILILTGGFVLLRGTFKKNQ
jgi:hypothetical protein